MPFPRRNPLFKAAYFGSKRLYALSGKIPPKNQTEFVVDGKPVVLIHNPKAAGTSLKAMLGMRAVTTHNMPRMAFSRRMWLDTFSVVAVRHPFDRFVSEYTFMVRARRGIMRHYPEDVVAQLDPFKFINVMRDFPEKLGPQSNWACYPDPVKPFADLVLKIEESDGWRDTLDQVGIKVCDGSKRLNSTRDNSESFAESLGIHRCQLERLEEAVYVEYRDDYATFGYERLPEGW